MTDQDCSPIEKVTSPSLDIQHLEKKLHATPEERQAALTQALAVDPGVKAGSWRAYQVNHQRRSRSLVPFSLCLSLSV